MLIFSEKLDLLLLGVFPFQPIHLIIAVFIMFLHVMCTQRLLFSKFSLKLQKILVLAAHLKLYYKGMKQSAGNQRAGFSKLLLII